MALFQGLNSSVSQHSYFCLLAMHAPHFIKIRKYSLGSLGQIFLGCLHLTEDLYRTEISQKLFLFISFSLFLFFFFIFVFLLHLHHHLIRCFSTFLPSQSRSKEDLCLFVTNSQCSCSVSHSDPNFTACESFFLL